MCWNFLIVTIRQQSVGFTDCNPKVKRLHIPGMLCIYGNLNPVISRLANNKLKTNHSFLIDYVKANPTSIVFYILRLID